MTDNRDFVDLHYQQNGRSTATDALGMREMQARAYEHRTERFLLIKAPPASGKSRALMYIALDKLVHQGLKRVVVAVPERSIGRSFQDTELRSSGFFADWKVAPYYDLCAVGKSDDGTSDADKARRFCEFFGQTSARVLLCAHATLRNGMKMLADDAFDDTLLAIDEFHHTSADADSGLGDIVRRVMNHSTGHIVAMTGSYFRGDGIPVLRREDEARFTPVTYNYYQQLNGYRYMRNLILGYHFYHGSYLDHIGEVLDTTKKTIVHIPSVNSRASTRKKYDETLDILNLIGKDEGMDYNTGIHLRRTSDGRLLRVADLVEDDARKRDRVQGFLQRMRRREDVDIIIALGTAKEGFDWPWCEMCLTVGVRGSLTEVIQIIGRCTRDCEGKDTARFVNMIAMPDVQLPEVKVAVNDFLKAITASLLMEQVMAPRWNFKTSREEVDDGDDPTRTIVVEGLRPLSSVRTRRIIEEDIDNLTAFVLQHPLMPRAFTDGVTAERVTRDLLPKIIHERFPDYTDGEVDELCQHWQLNALFAGREVTQDSEGNRLIQLTNRFVNIDRLNINLINEINPFQRAYEVLSRSVDAPTLKVIQDTINVQKLDMDIETAKRIFHGSYKEYVRTHDGHRPRMDDPSPRVREMAAAFELLANLKRKHDMGLAIDN